MATSSTRSVDLPTVIVMAASIYVVSVLLHEAGGHGGACMALGEHAAAWGAYYFDCATQSAPLWKSRLVAAAGSAVNLAVAAISGLWLWIRFGKSGQLGIAAAAMWLLFMVNSLTWSGYFVFSGVANIGDWSTQRDAVLYGVSNPLVLRAVMVAAGGILYFLCIRLGARWLSTLVGGAHRELGRRLALTSYLTGGITAVLIGLLNPMGMMIVLESAAASTLGGTAGLLSTFGMMPAAPAETNFDLPRNWLWMVVGLAGVGAYAAILGPTIKFG